MVHFTRSVTIVLTSLFVSIVGPAYGTENKQIDKSTLVVEPRGPSGTVEKRKVNKSLLPMPATESTLTRAQVKDIVEEHAQKLGVEVALVHAIITAESGYDTLAVSPAGALGVMQVMPKTAKDYGVQAPQELFDPRVNIGVGVRHLRRLLDKYKNDYGTAIMAYNAGEGAVDRTKGGVSFGETLDYVEAVIRKYRRLGGRRPTHGALQKIAMLRKEGEVNPVQSLSGKPPRTSALSESVRQVPLTRHIHTVRSDMSPKTLARFGFRSANKDNSAILNTFRRIR